MTDRCYREIGDALSRDGYNAYEINILMSEIWHKAKWLKETITCTRCGTVIRKEEL